MPCERQKKQITPKIPQYIKYPRVCQPAGIFILLSPLKYIELAGYAFSRIAQAACAPKQPRLP
jgi:hypothetical protein